MAVGAGAIALWLDVRFKARSPQTVVRTLAHMAVSLLFLQLSPALPVWLRRQCALIASARCCTMRKQSPRSAAHHARWKGDP